MTPLGLLSTASLTLAALGGLTVAACGKKEEAAGGGGAAPKVTIDPAAVNALVPADLKDKLVFEKGSIEEERGRGKTVYTMAVPKGWKADEKMKMFAKISPPGDDFMGSELSVGTNCSGMCTPKDWAAESDKANFRQFKDAKIIKDEKTDTSRLMIAERDDNTFVMYAHWTKTAKRYGTCMATLKKEYRPAADAFAKACQAIEITGDE